MIEILLLEFWIMLHLSISDYQPCRNKPKCKPCQIADVGDTSCNQGSHKTVRLRNWIPGCTLAPHCRRESLSDAETEVIANPESISINILCL